ncbi:gamma-aminobutyric acid type B receptor subunit 2-like isoform X1 [Hydractinia symbiolongicarpus]|uniref:gamma-aminobutyric acid type B receptor subunit 2-like isoform X1 n=1 Tax=Hydractinia symbiolongicarpus TaxID=13093 RepID=UPI002549D2B2|nr:gamma-aminobutyric acid type B receptor subunit 2-like isoform X1 [Hydractinia symbiolongicarpus]
MCFYLFPLASRKFERVGMYNPTTHKLTIERANVDVLGKEYVRDRTLVREYNEKHNLSVSYTIWTLSALGMVYALGLFFINNLYKNVRCIKMTSPVINNIIIFGCILCYIATILYGMDSRHIAVQKIGAMCNVSMNTGETAFQKVYSFTLLLHCLRFYFYSLSTLELSLFCFCFFVDCCCYAQCWVHLCFWRFICKNMADIHDI